MSHMFILASTTGKNENENSDYLITFQLRIVVLKKSSSLNNAQLRPTHNFI